MVTEKISKRKKPKFLRTDSHKMIKLGKTTNKRKKWRRPIGMHNKIRLNIRGKPKKVKVGWGADKRIKNYVDGTYTIKIENINELDLVKKGQGIIIAKVGKKKRLEIVEAIKKNGFIVLNKYRDKKERKNATR